jgi:uncharacterized membrane protein YkoI
MLKKVRTGVMALAAVGAIAVGASAIADAASNSGTTGQQSQQSQQSQGGTAGQQRAPMPADVGHGPNETLLSGDTASKVKQAALDKVPGATVLRVETDSEGSPYEAHLQKSDGSQVTVKVDKQFNATDVESGFGGGPPQGAPN